MKRIYYYITEFGSAQQLVFDYPLTEDEMIINCYRFLKSEKVDRYPWEDTDQG